jgi:hypothetical protein
VPIKQRTAKQRRAMFAAEVLDLFVALERTPEHRRHTREFKDAEHELMRRLHLVSEFWSMNSPLDRGRPCHPPGHIANDDWRRCREVRKALLAAVAEQEKAPAGRTGEGEEGFHPTRGTGLHS